MQKTSFSSTTASVLLDAMRGLAALVVLLEHWRNFFFVDFPQVTSHRWIAAPLYLICAAGHQAVIVFFVLSGFLVSGTVIRAVNKSNWSWSVYLIHRLLRLWIGLLPALLLGAFWDHLGIGLNLAPALYTGAAVNHLSQDFAASLSTKILLGNVFFLQNTVVPTFGSNGALWSLANEFWYYILFPLAFCLIRRVYRKPLPIAMSCALFVAISCFVTREMLLLFPIWLLGALLHRLPSIESTFKSRAIAAIVYVAIFWAAAVFGHTKHIGSGLIGDYALGLATFLFVWLLLGARAPEQPDRLSRTSREFARFSYTLYVAHTPILVFSAALLVHDQRFAPSALSMAASLAILVIAVLYCWFLAFITEFQTDRIRGWLEQRIFARNAPVLPFSIPSNTVD